MEWKPGSWSRARRAYIALVIKTTLVKVVVVEEVVVVVLPRSLLIFFPITDIWKIPAFAAEEKQLRISEDWSASPLRGGSWWDDRVQTCPPYLESGGNPPHPVSGREGWGESWELGVHTRSCDLWPAGWFSESHWEPDPPTLLLLCRGWLLCGDTRVSSRFGGEG